MQMFLKLWMVDRVSITKIPDLDVALQCLFSVFYIFNIEFPKSLASFFAFLQKEVVQLQDCLQPLPKTLKLVSLINC